MRSPRSMRPMRLCALLLSASALGLAGCGQVVDFPVGPDTVGDHPDMAVNVPPDMAMNPPDLAMVPCISASFDGKQGTHIGVPARAEYSPDGAFTLEAWIFAMPTGPNMVEFQRIAEHADPDAGITYALALGPAGEPVFNVTGDNFDSVVVPASEPLEKNRWIHLAGVFEGPRAVLYQDGKEVSRSPDTLSFSKAKAAMQPLTIGNSAVSQTTLGFTGLIDEVRLSNKARYTGPFTPAKRFATDTDTLGLFHLDEKPGTRTAPDSSALMNGGTLNGGSDYVMDCP